MVNIYYSYIKKQLPESLFEEYLRLLPSDQKTRNQRFVHWQERYLHLFGRLLLIEGLKQFGLGHGELDKLVYNKNDRPFLKNSEINFNISHSGNYAICVISENTKVGIDVEEIRPVEFADFKKVFTNQEWAEIEQSQNSLMKFYNFWTRKESVIKADGRGLSIPLDNIEVINNAVCYDNQVWYLTELAINSNYRVCLASNMENVSTSIVEMDFKK